MKHVVHFKLATDTPYQVVMHNAATKPYRSQPDEEGVAVFPDEHAASQYAYSLIEHSDAVGTALLLRVRPYEGSGETFFSTIRPVVPSTVRETDEFEMVVAEADAGDTQPIDTRAAQIASLQERVEVLNNLLEAHRSFLWEKIIANTKITYPMAIFDEACKLHWQTRALRGQSSESMAIGAIAAAWELFIYDTGNNNAYVALADAINTARILVAPSEEEV